MDFNDYQKQSRKTAIYPHQGQNYIYPVLGIVGEAGEVAEKIKKVIRDNGGQLDVENKQEIVKELGDILWYIAQMATELNVDLEKIAYDNLIKVNSRKKRQVLFGSGDNR